MERTDIELLRAEGLDDRAIVDANQVVAYFNYVNRVADGLGVELEPSWPAALRTPRSYGARLRDFPSSLQTRCHGCRWRRCARSID
jgi:hypothetical protein